MFLSYGFPPDAGMTGGLKDTGSEFGMMENGLRDTGSSPV